MTSFSVEWELGIEPLHSLTSMNILHFGVKRWLFPRFSIRIHVVQGKASLNFLCPSNSIGDALNCLCQILLLADSSWINVCFKVVGFQLVVCRKGSFVVIHTLIVTHTWVLKSIVRLIQRNGFFGHFVFLSHNYRTWSDEITCILDTPGHSDVLWREIGV